MNNLMHSKRLLIVAFSAICFNLDPLVAQPSVQQKSKHKTLIVFFDGLRPDYITAEQMPNLFDFKKDASFGSQHHSVFPTVTRVNSSSYSTGSYPGTHGLLGNAIYMPEVNKNKSTGTSYADLSKATKAISGPLLTAVSLGEVLQNAGEKMMVYSSGTTGQAFLQNHTVNGAIINPDLILPESMKAQVISEIGEIPSKDEDDARHKWITDALLKYSLADDGPLVSAIWYSDPDGAAHHNGIGSKDAVSAIKYVDGQFGRLISALKEKNLTDQFNIIISTDHGFVTHVGKQGLADFLIREGFKKDKESGDVVVADGGVYVSDHNPETIQKIVAALHKEEWVGAIFSRPSKKGDLKGWVPGTLSYYAIHYNHARAGDLLVVMNWDDRKNNMGYAGTSYAGGVAGHGGSSPYEINIALFAKGPDFKKSFTGTLPTSNIDITPTVISLYGLKQPAVMDGRVVTEFLKSEKVKPVKTTKEVIETQAKYPWGTYKLTLERSVLGKYRYVNFTKVQRDPVK
jgi:predicted AlkP superfamily pyrophosphatase or phosphodiesterase